MSALIRIRKGSRCASTLKNKKNTRSRKKSTKNFQNKKIKNKKKSGDSPKALTEPGRKGAVRTEEIERRRTAMKLISLEGMSWNEVQTRFVALNTPPVLLV